MTTERPGSSAGELRELFEDAYAGEPFVELVDSPPGVRDVRETNLCRIHATVEPATGRVIVFAAIDNLWKGAAGQAVQDLNLMLGLDETEGLASDASSARAGSSAPAARDASSSPRRCPRASAPRAWRPGIKPEGLDVGVLRVDVSDTVSARALHHQRPRGRARHRPRARRTLDRLRAVVANSGGSNVGDGERGLETARATQRLRRRAARHRARRRWAWPRPA